MTDHPRLVVAQPGPLHEAMRKAQDRQREKKAEALAKYVTDLEGKVGALSLLAHMLCVKAGGDIQISDLEFETFQAKQNAGFKHGVDVKPVPGGASFTPTVEAPDGR